MAVVKAKISGDIRRKQKIRNHEKWGGSLAV
jgi:hypothetical protein